MKLECLTVSVNFSDILAHTLPLNKNLFDRTIVVTDPGDTATKRVCEHNYVECIATDEFYFSDAAFNKARGINVGLAKLDASDWLIHMDSDIVLPARTRDFLERIVSLDPVCIYGVDRLMCPDYAAWSRHVAAPVLQHTAEIFVIPDAFPMGTRVAKLDGEGYVPIGFFQLWNPRGSGILDYPAEHGTAGRTDMLHALRWPRAKRVLIPELFAIHLGSPIPKGKTNWRGRVMAPFGPASVCGGSSEEAY
jgi:hypothetical protein